MKNVLAIGGSNSSKSINKVFANFIATQLENVSIRVLDWNEIEMPLFGIDLEEEKGIHENAYKFKELVEQSDAVVLSLAEHNGLHSAAFKNLWDWTSRIEKNFWANKPMFLAATSPGGRGGKGVLGVTLNMISRFGGNVISSFSLPSFQDNFKNGAITDDELKTNLLAEIKKFQEHLNQN